MKTYILAALCMLCSLNALYASDKVAVTVTNPLKSSRAAEMIEVDATSVYKVLGDACPVLVTDADGKEIPSQLTYDGKLIFQASVAAKGKSVYYITKGQPKAYAQRVFGRQFPERVDDMAWENDRVAFRCYGPALQRNKERAFGYDIWNKRTSELVVEKRYAQELDADIAAACKKLRALGQADLADDVYNAVSYHVDHGNGMDCYKVGPTLGAGAAALLNADGSILYPYCYTKAEVLDKGPLRFTVRLTYGESTIGTQRVVEERLLSLDAGSHLNRVSVSYAGLTTSNPVCAGIIVHNENPSAYVLNKQAGYMAYEDLGDPNQYKEKYRAKQNRDFGKIYVGTVTPERVDDMKFLQGDNLPGATGHILSVSTLRPNTSYTYYFGSAWSRNPETSITSLTNWEAYLSDFSSRLKAPLKIKVSAAK